MHKHLARTVYIKMWMSTSSPNVFTIAFYCRSRQIPRNTKRSANNTHKCHYCIFAQKRRHFCVYFQLCNHQQLFKSRLKAQAKFSFRKLSFPVVYPSAQKKAAPHTPPRSLPWKGTGAYPCAIVTYQRARNSIRRFLLYRRAIVHCVGNSWKECEPATLYNIKVQKGILKILCWLFICDFGAGEASFVQFITVFLNRVEPSNFINYFYLHRTITNYYLLYQKCKI